MINTNEIHVFWMKCKNVYIKMQDKRKTYSKKTKVLAGDVELNKE